MANQPQSEERRTLHSPNNYIARRARRRRRNHAHKPMPRWVSFFIRSGIALLVVFVGVSLVGLFLLDRAYSGRIIPNVAIQGLNLDAQTPDQASAALRQHYAAFLEAPVSVEYNSQTWQPTLEQIGVELRIGEAVDRAYSFGRGANVLTSIPEAIRIWREGIDLPLRISIDQQRLQAYLLAIGREIEQEPRNADISVLNGRILTMSAQTGRQVLVDDTASDILAQLGSLQPQRVTIRTRLIEPLIEDAGIASTKQRLQTLLSAPITLTSGEQQWSWDMQRIGMLVRIAREPVTNQRGYTLSATLDRGLLNQWLAPLANEIDIASVEPRVRFTTVGLQITTPGRDGARLEVATSIDQVADALWQEPRSIALPITVLQPQARPETLVNLGIGELVAQGKSSFEASAPYRVQNIQAGARQMDGRLIAPGEEFSFNRTVGAIDESNGFTQGYAIIDGRTQLEWGGGVCQVSTTVFRAAFWAGVPITERNQHSFRIRWYEVFEPIGMDAAIFTGPGGYDFRFINDTNTWLLMQTEVDTAGEVLTVNLYGTKSNREVVQIPATITNEVPAPTKPQYLDDPELPAGTTKQTDTARGGMDVTVGRVVKENGAIMREDRFFSRFQPWPDIFVRGTGR